MSFDLNCLTCFWVFVFVVSASVADEYEPVFLCDFD